MGRIAVIGEVLWDVFPDSTSLGGAPLNFAAHARRLGNEIALISAVGSDDLGRKTLARISGLGLDTGMVGVSCRWETGTARIMLGPDGEAEFTIVRPAAYDDIAFSDEQLRQLADWSPWDLYYGTLFASSESGHATLRRVLSAIPEARRFYDVNLRPDCGSPELIRELLTEANVVKLNETELEALHPFAGLPDDPEGFCRMGARLFGWEAACVTLGARGCALMVGENYVEVPGCRVRVADPVGAGDAFAAAFVHGLDCGWTAQRIAEYANRLGALVASRAGAIPDWKPSEISAS
jgi:fructokinase